MLSVRAFCPSISEDEEHEDDEDDDKDDKEDKDGEDNSVSSTHLLLKVRRRACLVIMNLVKPIQILEYQTDRCRFDINLAHCSDRT